jgi:EmrB/QacA subfamily drug resistance transporter
MLKTQRLQKWLPLAVIAAAHLMVVMDTTIMFVALPSAQHGLDLSVSGRQWVLTAYTLAFGGLLLLGGRLADRLGARTTLRIGALGFALASALGGLAPDAAVLIAARAIEGAFGALLVSSTKSLLVTVYSGEKERARAIGIFTATLTAGAAVGLVLGGVLTSLISWRWCLYVNLPVSLAVLTASSILPAIPARPEVRFDLLGAGLICGGMVALVYGLGAAASDGWGSGTVIWPLAVATALIATFGLRAAKVPGSLLPPRIVADRDRGGALLALVFNSLSTFGMMLILTFQLQSVLGYSPLVTGLCLAPFMVTTGIAAAIVAPRLMARVPARPLILVGLALGAVGLVPLLALTTTSHYFPLIFLATVVEGIGTGLASPPALGTSLSGVEPGDRGAAGAISSAAGQVGSSVGTALFNTIAATATAAYLAGGGVGSAAATVHGYTTALAWGVAILLAALIPIAAWMRPGPRAKARPAGGTGPREA